MEKVAPVDSLASTRWLREHLNDPGVRILDARGYVHHIDDGKGNMVIQYAGAKGEYDTAQHPGAGSVDWTADILPPEGGGLPAVARPPRDQAAASAASRLTAS